MKSHLADFCHNKLATLIAYDSWSREFIGSAPLKIHCHVFLKEPNASFEYLNLSPLDEFSRSQKKRSFFFVWSSYHIEKPSKSHFQLFEKNAKKHFTKLRKTKMQKF